MFEKEAQAFVKKVYTDSSSGDIVKEESDGTKQVLVCRPPLAVSGFPYRNRVVGRFSTCGKGEAV